MASFLAIHQIFQSLSADAKVNLIGIKCFCKQPKLCRNLKFFVRRHLLKYAILNILCRWFARKSILNKFYFGIKSYGIKIYLLLFKLSIVAPIS